MRSLRVEHVVNGVIGVARLSELCGKTQHLGALHRSAHRLALGVFITPRGHLTGCCEMRKAHGANGLGHCKECSKFRFGAALGPADHRAAHPPFAGVVHLITARNERGKLIVKGDRFAFNVARSMNTKRFDPVNERKAKGQH